MIYTMDYRFYKRILKNFLIFIKKNRDIWNTKHFHNSIVYYFLFDFFVFLTSYFLFYLSIVVKKFLKFCISFLYGLEILSKNFSKLWFFLFKKFEIFEIQNFSKIPSFTFFFIYLAFLKHFFSILPIQSCQKIMEFLVVF